MASVYTIVVTLLAIVTLGSTQHLGDPGTEPWLFVVRKSCPSKGVKGFTDALNTARTCIQGLSGGPGRDSLAICSKKSERNECLKPYYELIKTCFSTDAQKKQVDKAFEAQDEAVNYLCEDNGKRVRELTEEDRCQAKSDTECSKSLLQDLEVEGTGLFDMQNCKVMYGLAKCAKANFDYCKTTAKADLTLDQINAILDETPCDEVSGVSSSLNVCVASSLFFSLICQVVMKFIL